MCADSRLCVTIEALFAAAVGEPGGVRLVARTDEPLYLPPAAGQYARLGYVSGHPRSALHEIAHWCIAGPTRRRQLDFGYWYTPDGRDVRAQRAFERVEARPQALELLFCRALDVPFEVSVDNLAAQRGSTLERAVQLRFARAVEASAAAQLQQRRPRTAFVFLAALECWCAAHARA